MRRLPSVSYADNRQTGQQNFGAWLQRTDALDLVFLLPQIPDELQSAALRSIMSQGMVEPGTNNEASEGHDQQFSAP